jgi:hypothetical protein
MAVPDPWVRIMGATFVSDDAKVYPQSLYFYILEGYQTLPSLREGSPHDPYPDKITGDYSVPGE